MWLNLRAELQEEFREFTYHQDELFLRFSKRLSRERERKRLEMKDWRRTPSGRASERRSNVKRRDARNAWRRSHYGSSLGLRWWVRPRYTYPKKEM